MNQELRIKNKITFLHNNLQEGTSYQINGKTWVYIGFLPIVKGGEKVHNFKRKDENLALTREDLIVLDLFNEIEL